MPLGFGLLLVPDAEGTRAETDRPPKENIPICVPEGRKRSSFEEFVTHIIPRPLSEVRSEQGEHKDVRRRTSVL